MKLFVPGRICLFGEHTDWAGGYRRINGSLEKGFTLICGTNQGLYAEVKPHPAKLIFKTTLVSDQFEIPMKREALLEEAQKGGVFSYVAGVAYQVLTHYRVHGLEIDNYRTDLPVKKGLSSSAATCVLVARAFNRTYDLKMTIRGEMEFAYLGEITTPSRCGRMDQGCAYGDRPVMMTFDGDRIDVEEVVVGNNLHFVIVDLGAGKDTKEILSKLNHSYPFAENDLQRGVQRYLGEISAGITRKAVDALRRGDAVTLGMLMKKSQEEFDRSCMPACPSQLTAPVLHRVLGFPAIQPFILGGKGVGSQGDGTAQFIVKDGAAQAKVIEIIESQLNMTCLNLTIGAAKKVRKAVIPAAGFGTRLFPATKTVKKELFPVIDKNGIAKPAILVIVEEAIAAGIEELCVIVQKGDREVFEEFFHTPPPVEHFNKLSREAQKQSASILEIGHRITFIEQPTQDGFGHAVYCTREWVGNEPFLLMLGDHLYVSDTGVSCARQLLDIYEQYGRSVVGCKSTPGAEIHNFGTVAGVWEVPQSLLSITEFAEKPDVPYAAEHLHMEGMAENQFLTVFGQYVLSPRIFEFLQDHIEHNMRDRGEYQLTPCLDTLRQEDGFLGYLVQGRRFDIGVPRAYLQTLIDFASA
ncbi:MAG: sugar phosphate nucleotidyltransferase [Chitinispirillaceae bacterium]|jgi:UTP-glucose-1-phosphate uridylyltransferase/mevalonate kinase